MKASQNKKQRTLPPPCTFNTPWSLYQLRTFLQLFLHETFTVQFERIVAATCDCHSSVIAAIVLKSGLQYKHGMYGKTSHNVLVRLAGAAGLRPLASEKDMDRVKPTVVALKKPDCHLSHI